MFFNVGSFYNTIAVKVEGRIWALKKHIGIWILTLPLTVGTALSSLLCKMGMLTQSRDS